MLRAWHIQVTCTFERRRSKRRKNQTQESKKHKQTIAGMLIAGNVYISINAGKQNIQKAGIYLFVYFLRFVFPAFVSELMIFTKSQEK
jgi:hypothetical protein